LSRVPEFSATDQPGEIVAAAGEWLASELGDGFKYLRSKRELTRKTTGRVETFVLQTSTWSRTGQGTWVTVRITVRDDRVRKWQAEHLLVGMYSTEGFIFNSLVTNMGLPDLELFGPLREGPAGHFISLKELRAAVLGDILAKLKILRGTPTVAAEQLPDSWIVFPEPPFWWATAYGERAAATRFLSRYFELKPGARIHFESGRRLALESGSEPPSINNMLVALGWSAVSSGALAADEPI
jgi:hypothetical protein